MKEKILNYIKENEIDTNILRNMVSELNSWDGSFDDYYYWENDEEFFNTFYPNNPMDAVRAAYYGNYNYADPLVHINAYGNLDSCDEWEVEEQLKNDATEIVSHYLDEMEDNPDYFDYDYLNLDDELKELFDEFMNEEVEDE